MTIAALLAVSILAGASEPSDEAPPKESAFTDLGEDIKPKTESWLKVEGMIRARGEVLYNLDLDRGLTPSGDPLFPVPLSDRYAQSFEGGDLRLRTDISAIAPFGGVALNLRVDILDGLRLGGAPEGNALSTRGTSPPVDAFRVKRAYAQVLTPIGLLAAGRMQSHFGLGMLVNGGDCADCDHGDAADRIAFATPLLGHVVAVAFDLTATGPAADRGEQRRPIDLEPTDDVRTLSIALHQIRTDRARVRRKNAGKSTLEYGVVASHRWQKSELLEGGDDEADRVLPRGFIATAFGGWSRLDMPWGRIELEAALLLAEVEQASLIPGVLLEDKVTSRQIGAALESDFGSPGSPLRFGVDLGYASGDSAPGFGAEIGRPDLLDRTYAGDLDGPQAVLPHDWTVDNFRFHPDYRIDRILFREIIGTVTDAVYARPHVSYRALELGPGTLIMSVAAVGSMAIEASSTPGGRRPLGIELDPTISYAARDGFSAALEHAVLFPLAGLDNRIEGLTAKPAQLVRLRLAYVF